MHNTPVPETCFWRYCFEYLVHTELYLLFCNCILFELSQQLILNLENVLTKEAVPSPLLYGNQSYLEKFTF